MEINSKYGHIGNHTQLMYAIMQLNASKVEQEEEVKYKLKEIYYSFQPATLLENAFSNKPKIKKNLAQTSMALGKDFLISKLFKKGSSVKGFLLSKVMEKVVDYALGGQTRLIIKGVGKLGGLIKRFKS